MSVRHTIGRGQATAQAAHVLLLAALACTHAGCQWLLEDIDATSDAAEPSSVNDDAGQSGSEPEDIDDASEQGGGAEADPPGNGQGNHSGSMDAGQGSAPLPDAAGGGGGSDSAIAGGRDGGVGGRDGGVTDAALAHDSAAPVRDADLSCSEPVLWYQDGDEDGYGRSSSSVRVCPAPAGKWARSAGDCNDDDGRVHPDQLEYFGEPYQAPDGSESFDYDCSGGEEGNGTQEIMTGCGLLELAVCVGGGYLPTTRPGAPNPVCGSHAKATCRGAVLGALVCNPEEDTVVEPYWCR